MKREDIQQLANTPTKRFDFFEMIFNTGGTINMIDDETNEVSEFNDVDSLNEFLKKDADK